jgi:hypothetical protein
MACFEVSVKSPKVSQVRKYGRICFTIRIGRLAGNCVLRFFRIMLENGAGIKGLAAEDEAIASDARRMA